MFFFIIYGFCMIKIQLFTAVIIQTIVLWFTNNGTFYMKFL